jgi:hypothetical protein
MDNDDGSTLCFGTAKLKKFPDFYFFFFFYLCFLQKKNTIYLLCQQCRTALEIKVEPA